MRFDPSGTHTVASLRVSRGKHRYAMLRIETLDEAWSGSRSRFTGN